jgi:hypothetical protein
MRDQEAKQEVLKFTEALGNAGVRTGSVSYSGCGDEGRTEAPQFESAEGKPIGGGGRTRDLRCGCTWRPIGSYSSRATAFR